jgi:cystathionine gamma-synthase
VTEHGTARTGGGPDHLGDTCRADRHAEPVHPETLAVTSGRDGSPGAPLNVPPTFASTFRDGETVRYGRWENPTWNALEEALGALEGGSAAVFSCGQAAAAAVLGMLDHGATVIYPVDAYLGTRQLLDAAAEAGRIRAFPVDVTDTEAVLGALADLGPGGNGAPAACLWLESPTNPLLGVADLPALLEAAGRGGVVSVVDNTFATPLVQRPLAWGASMVVHSATKYIGGHSDLLLGAVVTCDPNRRAGLVAHRTREGAVPGVMEAFLALRGLRTLPVRIQRQQETAATLAQRLERHPAVVRVRYPGLPSHPQHARARDQMRGFGAMLSFEVEGAARADRVVATVRLAVPTTSLGGVETTIERRARWPGDAHVNPGLVRMSVGLEHAEDLWADLAAALERALDEPAG